MLGAVLLAGCHALAPLLYVPAPIWSMLFEPGSDKSIGRDLAAFEEKGDWAGMLKFAQARLETDSVNHEWLFVCGYATYQMGNYAAAKAYFTNATTLVPENAVAWIFLGETFRASGDPRRALELEQRGLRIDNRSALGWFFMGHAFADTGQQRRAAEAYQEAVRNENEFVEAWYALGLQSAKIGDKRQAEAALHSLRQLAPARAEQLFVQLQTQQQGQPPPQR